MPKTDVVQDSLLLKRLPVELLALIFEKMDNLGVNDDKTSRQVAREQFNRQFPGGVVTYPESQYDFNLLAEIITLDPILREQQEDFNTAVKAKPTLMPR